jgi:hypothetical protein
MGFTSFSINVEPTQKYKEDHEAFQEGCLSLRGYIQRIAHKYQIFTPMCNTIRPLQLLLNLHLHASQFRVLHEAGEVHAFGISEDDIGCREVRFFLKCATDVLFSSKVTKMLKQEPHKGVVQNLLDECNGIHKSSSEHRHQPICRARDPFHSSTLQTVDRVPPLPCLVQDAAPAPKPRPD